MFLKFGHQNPGSGWDPDPDRYQPQVLELDPYQMNTDPKPWSLFFDCLTEIAIVSVS